MMYHIRKYLARILMVTSELRATVVVRESDDFFYRRIVREFLFKLLLDALCHTVHATYCRDDPKFVADAGTTISTTITFEESLVRSWSYLCKIRLI